MELQHEGLLELRHGSGAYISAPRGGKARAAKLVNAQTRVRSVIEGLRDDGFSADEIRRLFEAQLNYTTDTARKQ